MNPTKCLFLFLMALLVVRPFDALAQDFEVAPVDIEFTSEPGESDYRTVLITNHSNKKVSFLLGMADFLTAEDGSSIEKPAGSTDRSCVNWLTASPMYFDLNPNDSKEVMVSIIVPKGDFSTRWARLYVKTTEEQTAFSADKNLAAGVILSPRITIRVIQSPKSNNFFAGKITGIKEIQKDNPEAPGNRYFNATVKNTGDKVNKCKVFLLLTNIETEAETRYPPLVFNLYPGAQKIVELAMPSGVPPGKYAVSAILDYGHGNLEGTQMVIDIQ
ncbi:MAG: hypothetical protein KKA07_01385 [Bacteroidetes bacterium]|nr:hypothetical protein [Bacteroidota bacterium]MBU1717702.1 hypothetical protein [Bacteroidota bacterium]